MFQLLQLRDDHPVVLGNSNTVKQGIETVESNIKWMSLHQKEVGAWLAAHQPVKTSFINRQQIGLLQLLD